MVRITETTTHEVYLSDEEMHRINEGGIVEFDVNGDTVQVGAEPDYFESDLPEEGDVLNDPQAPRWSSGDVRVVEVTDSAASGYEITVNGRETTVARENPSCDSEAQVVRAEYVGGSGKVYPFPSDRLDR